jgi:hypothetical protein
MITSSIALAADYDPTTPSARKTFVGWTSVPTAGPAPVVLTGDDVYRVDDSTVRKLEAGISAGQGVWSVAFSGTVAGGTLVCGESGLTAPVYGTVHYATDPQLSAPSWTSSAKSPTGGLPAAVPPAIGATSTVVGIDAADATKVYAGTAGWESAFSASRNGAKSFNQIGQIDTSVNVLEDVEPSPDGAVLFLATGNTTGGALLDSLWKTTTPASAVTWERVSIATPNYPNYGNANSASIIRLSPEYLDTPALYWADSYGPAVSQIKRSVDGGDVFASRTSPCPIGDIAVENADILYLGDSASTNVYASTNGAWFFGLPVNSGVVGAVWDLEMAPSYPNKPIPGYLLAGGVAIGSVVRSPSANAFWIPVTPFIPGGTALTQVLADDGFADNNTIYAGDSTAGAGIWRFQIDTSTVWEQIAPLVGVVNDNIPIPFVGAEFITGLQMEGGTLYGNWFAGAPPPAGLGVSGTQRSLVPDTPVIAAWTFQTMNVGSGLAAFFNMPNSLKACTTNGSVDLYAIDVAAQALMAYDDSMAKAKPAPTVPAEVPASLAELTRGWNAQFNVSWPEISNATAWDLEIYADAACSQRLFALGIFPTTPGFIPANPLTPSVVIPPGTVTAGQDYFLRLRARNQIPGDMILSPWSSVQRFTVTGGEVVEVPYEGVQPLAPQPGQTGVPRAGTGFSWSPYTKATRYEFVLAKDAELTDVVATAKVTTTAYKFDGNLDYSTTYFWAVRAIEPTTTPWSPVSSFTTEAAPPPPPTPAPTPAPAPPPVVTPTIIWAIIGIGAILVIAVIALIVRTRRAGG